MHFSLVDTRRPFLHATIGHTLQTGILLATYHVPRHLGEARDMVRKQQYGRLRGRGRAFINGNKCTLLADLRNPRVWRSRMSRVRSRATGLSRRCTCLRTMALT